MAPVLLHLSASDNDVIPQLELRGEIIRLVRGNLFQIFFHYIVHCPNGPNIPDKCIVGSGSFFTNRLATAPRPSKRALEQIHLHVDRRGDSPISESRMIFQQLTTFSTVQRTLTRLYLRRILLKQVHSASCLAHLVRIGTGLSHLLTATMS